MQLQLRLIGHFAAAGAPCRRGDAPAPDPAPTPIASGTAMIRLPPAGSPQLPSAMVRAARAWPGRRAPAAICSVALHRSRRPVLPGMTLASQVIAGPHRAGPCPAAGAHADQSLRTPRRPAAYWPRTGEHRAPGLVKNYRSKIWLSRRVNPITARVSGSEAGRGPGSRRMWTSSPRHRYGSSGSGPPHARSCARELSPSGHASSPSPRVARPGQCTRVAATPRAPSL